MDTVYAQLVAVTPDSALSAIAAFFGRLGSDKARLLVCIIVAVLVGLVVGQKNKSLGWFAAFGGLYLSWFVWNGFTGSNTPFFTNDRSPGVLWSVSTNTPLATLFFVLALIFGVIAFLMTRMSIGGDKKSKAKKGSSIITAAFAGISVWTAVMFVYGLLFVQILRMA